MAKKKLPQFLQPILWSVKIDHLDLEKDKVYIINQVLAFGGWEDLKWLFKSYSLQTIKSVFLKRPIKTYYPATYNFIKEILLGLRNTDLRKERYVVNTPRIIR